MNYIGTEYIKHSSKDRFCCRCGERILKGTPYVRIAWSEGGVYHQVSHEECEKLSGTSLFSDYQDELSEDDFCYEVGKYSKEHSLDSNLSIYKQVLKILKNEQL